MVVKIDKDTPVWYYLYEVIKLGKRKEIDLAVIKDERIKRLIILAIKHNFSPTTMAHFIGVSYGTYNRYQQGRTVPQSANTRAVIDNIIEKLK